MRDIRSVMPLAAALALAALLPATDPAWCQEPGPVLNVLAVIQPSMTIELSDNLIDFHADSGPGVYDADKTVDVSVATNYGSWTLNCSASPLIGTAGEIPASRLFTSNNNTLSSPDEGAGATYENLGAQKLVAQGAPQALAVVNTLRFRLKTEWTDRAGSYAGTISFTYLAEP